MESNKRGLKIHVGKTLNATVVHLDFTLIVMGSHWNVLNRGLTNRDKERILKAAREELVIKQRHGQ